MGGAGGGGGHYHKQSEGLDRVLCHSPSHVTTSRCARSLRLFAVPNKPYLISFCGR